mmetsp:Transcript_19577/g.77994  ORF Transcript_19577/g.77994 Transcript_19577/m.77994 type:complete len:214 (+) Transcript_19577:2431-3072(+)
MSFTYCVIDPGRRIVGGFVVVSSTVDSMPRMTCPPSRTEWILPPRSVMTCDARVGEGLPEELADGAAMGRPVAARREHATGCFGTRTATVSKPAVTSEEIFDVGCSVDKGRTRLRGPGQNFSASKSAGADIAANPASSRASRLAMCTISGLSAGLPFALNTIATASVLVASAPRPYTVSVGNATTSPRLSDDAASATSVSLPPRSTTLILQFS